jgi:hypothetical protein
VLTIEAIAEIARIMVTGPLVPSFITVVARAAPAEESHLISSPFFCHLLCLVQLFFAKFGSPNYFNRQMKEMERIDNGQFSYISLNFTPI